MKKVQLRSRRVLRLWPKHCERCNEGHPRFSRVTHSGESGTRYYFHIAYQNEWKCEVQS